MREAFIENNVIRNSSQVLSIRDAVYIRRCRVGRGFGVADLVFLPSRGAHRLVVVEAKQGSSVDSRINLVGQLLMYYAGALRLGARGVRLMRRYAAEYPRSARSLRPKSLKMLTGGVSPPERAWAELCKGRTLKPSQVALYLALDMEPGNTLKSALSDLAQHHGLSVGVVSVLGRDRLHLWRARAA